MCLVTWRTCTTPTISSGPGLWSLHWKRYDHSVQLFTFDWLSSYRVLVRMSSVCAIAGVRDWLASGAQWDHQQVSKGTDCHCVCAYQRLSVWSYVASTVTLIAWRLKQTVILELCLSNFLKAGKALFRDILPHTTVFHENQKWWLGKVLTLSFRLKGFFSSLLRLRAYNNYTNSIQLHGGSDGNKIAI